MPSKLTYDKLVDRLLKGQWKKDFEEMAKTATESLKQVEAAFKRINAQARSLGSDAKSLLDLRRLQAENDKLKSSYDRLKRVRDEATQAARVEQQLQAAIAREKAKHTQRNIELTASLQRQREATRQAVAQQKNLTDEFKRNNVQMSGLASSVKSYIAAWFGITGIISLVKNLFTNTQKLESLAFSFKSVITDSNELASTEIFLTDVSKKYGQELLGLSDNYLRFRAAVKTTGLTLGESRGIFESFTKVGAVLGKTAADMDLIFLALEQMISKGTVTTEELRRQLGERIPGAFNIAAKSMGVTVKELNKMLKDGNVITEEMLPKFAEELEKTFNTENLSNIDTLVAATARLKTEWQLFVKALNASDTFKGFVNFLTKTLQAIKYNLNPELKAMDEALKMANNEFAAFLDLKLDGVTNESEKLKLINERLEGTRKALEDYKKTIVDVSGKKLVLPGSPQDIQIKAYEQLIRLLEEYSQSVTDANKKEIESIGYIEQLQQEIKALKDARDKLTRNGEKDVQYYKSIDDYNEQINKKQEELNDLQDKRNRKEKSYNDALREALGLIKAEKDAYQDLYDITELAKEADRLLKEGTKDASDALKDYDREDRERLRGVIEYRKQRENDLLQLLVDLGLKKSELYDKDVELLDLALKRGEITETQYLTAKAKLWVQYHQGIVESVQFAYDQINNLVNTYLDAQVQLAQAEFDLHDQAISGLESRLDEEKRLKDEGSRNDYDRLVTQMANEKKLRDKAIEDLKKARKAQAAIDLAQQTGSLIVAAANIFKGTAKDPVTAIIAAGTIAGMIASFIGFKAKIKSIESDYEEYGKGGWIRGKSHKQGGVNINAEGDEFMVNKKSAKQSKRLLESVNKGLVNDQTIMYLSAMNQIDLGKQTDRSGDIIDELRKGNEASMKLVNLYKNDIKAVSLGNGKVLIISNGGLKREVYTRE